MKNELVKSPGISGGPGRREDKTKPVLTGDHCRAAGRAMLEPRPGQQGSIEHPTRDSGAGDPIVDLPGRVRRWRSWYTRSRQRACLQDMPPWKVLGEPLPNPMPNPPQGSECTGWSNGNVRPYWAPSSAWLHTFWPVSGHCTHKAGLGCCEQRNFHPPPHPSADLGATACHCRVLRRLCSRPGGSSVRSHTPALYKCWQV